MASEKAKEGSRRRNSRHYQSHKEQRKQWRDEYRRTHPLRCVLSRAKHRAKQLGVPFSLTEQDLTKPDVCPVLGIALNWAQGGRKGYFPDSASLDRLVPACGYVPGNVRIISARANLLKNNATIRELLSVIEYMKETNRGVDI